MKTQLCLLTILLMLPLQSAFSQNAVYNNALSNNGALNNSSNNNFANNGANNSNNFANNGSNNGYNNSYTNNSANTGLNSLGANNSVARPNNSYSPNNFAQPSNNLGPSINFAAPTNSAPVANTAPATNTAATAVAPVSSNTNLPEVGNDPERLTAEEKVSNEIKNRLVNDLNKYCLDYCSVLSVDVRSKEAFNTSQADLGFESVGDSNGRNFKIQSVNPTVLVDGRFGSVNIERLQRLFNQVVLQYPYPVLLRWNKVTFPETSNTAKGEAEIRSEFGQQVRSQLDRIVNEFCPNECKIHSLDVDVSRASVDDIQSGAVNRYLFARDGRGALYVRGVNGRVSLSSEMDGERKRRIENLMRESLAPFGAVNLVMREIAFPRSATEIQKDLDAEREDPYGLGKLEAMLRMFKEHAGTKEIYKETDSRSIQNQSNSSERNSSLSESSSNSSNSSLSSNSNNSNNSTSAETTNQKGESFWTQRNMLIVGGILLALVIIGAIGLRHVVTGKRMQAVIHEANHNLNAQQMTSGMGYDGMDGGTTSVPGQVIVGNFRGAGASAHPIDMTKRIELDTLQEELIRTFISHPKVARDVFGRMLRDEGIEQSARYVAIFGEVIIFELLGDADLKKDIGTLAEYVHINLPTVADEERLQLLKNLKLRLTASKMRQMSSKTLDVFDFLKGKSGRQIYELVNDESARVQGIVLTQLTTDKRREVFELFEGGAKVDLLRELSNSDLVARDYLINVADALKRKAMTKPNFEAENTRGSDVLIDLLERAELQEQRDLMAELDQTNPEAARMLRTRLVTIETLPFLRDGLLIEIFLNMEPQAMATFLAGTRDHIRRLIFSKAPPDLAAGWSENLENLRAIDHDTYRLAEMQVISKIRGLSSGGLINLMEINNSLYPRIQYQAEGVNGDLTVPGGARGFRITKPIVA